jgi:hypothetical protein
MPGFGANGFAGDASFGLLLASTLTAGVTAPNGRFSPDVGFGPAGEPASAPAQELSRSHCEINSSNAGVGCFPPAACVKWLITHRRLGGVSFANSNLVFVASSLHLAMKSAICRSSADGPAASLLAATTAADGAVFGGDGLSPEVGVVAVTAGLMDPTSFGAEGFAIKGFAITGFGTAGFGAAAPNLAPNNA